MTAELGAPREGVFAGGLPYLALGHGEPLICLPGGTPNHHNRRPVPATADLARVRHSLAPASKCSSPTAGRE
jgi:hypothetical protein